MFRKAWQLSPRLGDRVQYRRQPRRDTCRKVPVRLPIQQSTSGPSSILVTLFALKPIGQTVWFINSPSRSSRQPVSAKRICLSTELVSTGRHNPISNVRHLVLSSVYPIFLILLSTDVVGFAPWFRKMVSLYEAEPTVHGIASSPELTQASPSAVCPRRP